MKKIIPSASELIPLRFKTEMFDEFAFPSPGNDSQIRCIIRFDGKINRKRLLRAIRLSFDAEPILGCRFVNQWRRYYWKRADDLDRMELCRIVESAHIDADMKSFILTPMDPCADLPLHVRMFRNGEDVLCVKMHHMVSDASGVKDYIYLLANIYKRLADNPDYIPKRNIHGDRSFKQVRKQFNFSDKLKILRRGYRNWKSDSFPRKSWTFPFVQGNNFDREILIRRFGTERFCALKEYSRKHKCTIHEIMTAAVLRVLYKIISPVGDTPLRLGTSVDLRRYIPEGKGDAICNLSTFFLLNIGHEIGELYEDTLIRVRDTFKYLKDDCLGLGFYYGMMINLKEIIPSTWASWLCNHMILFNNKLNYGNVCPRLTNIGLFDTEQLGFGDVDVADIFITPPITYPPIFMPVLSGFGETLTMSIGFANAKENRQLVELFLDGVDNELPK